MPVDPPSPKDGKKPASAGKADAAVAASLDDIRGLLTDLMKTVARDHDRAAHREKVIDRLHEENERLRRNELQTAFEPVRAALYRLYDLVRREAAREPMDPAHVPEFLGAIADELAEILARTGVERMPIEEGDTFDPKRHRPLGTCEVPDTELEGTVVTVQRDGFMQGGKVVRRAEVIVAKAAPTPVGGD